MNFIPDLSQGQAVILALSAAAMWGTWFISLKHLNGFPVAAFYLELFITSFLLVWGIGLLVDGRLIFSDIQRVFALRPSKILLVYACGIGYVVGMSLSIKVMTMIGLTLSQPLQSTIALVIGTTVTTTVGGIPENLKIINLIAAVFFLFGSIMFVTFAQRGVAKAKKKLESLSDLAKDPHIMRKAIILILLASVFVPAYTLGLSYGLKTITQDVGLAPLPYMCVIVTGALTGAFITSGISLTRKKQWGCFRTFPLSVHKFGIFSGLFHYGGNIIHSFGTGVLSTAVSWPLGLTAGLWTQLWGIKYGEFKGAPVSSYVYQGCSFACYVIGASFIVF